jgi:hypothetical protein
MHRHNNSRHLDCIKDAAYDERMAGMRTTVTLDPDVAEQLKDLARRRNVSFSDALNSTLRAGLATEQDSRRPFKVESRPMGLRPGVDLTKALQLAADLEDEEIIRKLKLGK